MGIITTIELINDDKIQDTPYKIYHVVYQINGKRVVFRLTEEYGLVLQQGKISTEEMDAIEKHYFN